ncbi:MAG: hypothetical protein WC708_05910 [Lentisphaeria bacterium]
MKSPLIGAVLASVVLPFSWVGWAAPSGGKAGAGKPAYETFPVGEATPPIVCKADSKWSYHLYLPPQYTADRTWPAMFIMNPGGGDPGTLDRYRKGADFNGIILAVSVQSKNSYDGAGKAISAMANDLPSRVAADPDRLMASGFSGGARMAFALAAAARSHFIGVLPCGAGRNKEDLGNMTVYGLCGTNCFNRWDMACTDRDLPGRDNRLVFFPGVHEWANEELIWEGMTWINASSLRGKRDPVLVKDRNALAAKMLEQINADLESRPDRAFEWAGLLASLGAPESVKAKSIRDRLKSKPEVITYRAALKAQNQYVGTYFATKPSDWVANTLPKAALKDSAKLAEKYQGTPWEEMFRRMGEPAQK